MRIVLIAIHFPPLCTSTAVQLRDLAIEFTRQGHSVTILTPSEDINDKWKIELRENLRIVRLKSSKTRDISYIRRTIAEFLLPFIMLWNLKKSPLATEKWDGVVWYSPTIFLGPIAKSLKRRSQCRSYLINRDIFPEWAVDLGLMRRSFPYYFFKAVANYQYSVADVIGVQTPGNLSFFDKWARRPDRKLEVLQNWLAESEDMGCSISLKDTVFKDKTIFVYAGNMGVSQGMSTLIDLAESLKERSDIGFLFVGRGSDAKNLRHESDNRNLKNVLFYDEINPNEISGLYAQCHVGLVALDPRHRTHNIPGKFLSYMQSGLPVLARVNPGNDLIDLIKNHRVGKVGTTSSVEDLKRLALELLTEINENFDFKVRCKELSNRLFSPYGAVRQIVDALKQ